MDLAFGIGLRVERAAVGATSSTTCRRNRRPMGRWRMDYNIVSSERVEVISGEDGDGPVTAKYKFGVEVTGAMSKQVFQTIFAEFKKKARFPGFKIGQVPPFMKKEITGFALQEVLTNSVSAALENNNLEAADADSPEASFDPDFDVLKKQFSPGKDMAFSVEIACIEKDTDGDDSEESSE